MSRRWRKSIIGENNWLGASENVNIQCVHCAAQHYLLMQGLAIVQLALIMKFQLSLKFIPNKWKHKQLSKMGNTSDRMLLFMDGQEYSLHTLGLFVLLEVEHGFQNNCRWLGQVPPVSSTLLKISNIGSKQTTTFCWHDGTFSSPSVKSIPPEESPDKLNSAPCFSYSFTFYLPAVLHL